MNNQNVFAYAAGATVAAVVVFSAMYLGADQTDPPAMQTQRSIISSAEQIVAESPDRRMPNRSGPGQTRIRVVPTTADTRARW